MIKINFDKILKSKKRVGLAIASTAIAFSMMFGAISCAKQNSTVDSIDLEGAEQQEIVEIEPEIKEVDALKTENIYADLDFKAMQYGQKFYLTLSEEDFLFLIRKEIAEVDQEYTLNGNTSVFASGDSQFSRFDEYHILGLMMTETS